MNRVPTKILSAENVYLAETDVSIPWSLPSFCSAWLRLALSPGPGTALDVVSVPWEKTVMFLNISFFRKAAVLSGLSDEHKRLRPLCLKSHARSFAALAEFR